LPAVARRDYAGAPKRGAGVISFDNISAVSVERKNFTLLVLGRELAKAKYGKYVAQ
jgi:hypothetical protein